MLGAKQQMSTKKYSLIPCKPPVSDASGKMVWKPEQVKFLTDAFNAGYKTGSEIKRLCGSAWGSVPAKKISSKLTTLGLKKESTYLFHNFSQTNEICRVQYAGRD